MAVYQRLVRWNLIRFVQALLRGEVVQFGELGNFQLKIGSGGVQDVKDYDASMFKSPHIVFRPSLRMKREISKVSVEKWPVVTVPGSGSGSGSEDDRPVIE